MAGGFRAWIKGRAPKTPPISEEFLRRGPHAITAVAPRQKVHHHRPGDPRRDRDVVLGDLGFLELLLQLQYGPGTHGEGDYYSR